MHHPPLIVGIFDKVDGQLIKLGLEAAPHTESTCNSAEVVRQVILSAASFRVTSQAALSQAHASTPHTQAHRERETQRTMAPAAGCNAMPATRRSRNVLGVQLETQLREVITALPHKATMVRELRVHKLSVTPSACVPDVDVGSEMQCTAYSSRRLASVAAVCPFACACGLCCFALGTTTSTTTATTTTTVPRRCVREYGASSCSTHGRHERLLVDQVQREQSLARTPHCPVPAR